MVQDDSVNTAAGRLRADINRFREDLCKMGQDVASLLRQGLGAGKSATTNIGGRFKDAHGAMGEKVGGAIESKPLVVIGTAFAAGLLAGMLLRRSHED